MDNQNNNVDQSNNFAPETPPTQPAQPMAKPPHKPLMMSLIISAVAAFILLITTILFFTMYLGANSDKQDLEKDLSAVKAENAKLIEESEKAKVKSDTTSDLDLNSANGKAFSKAFMSSCNATSGGQEAYCQCSLDYIVENDMIKSDFSGYNVDMDTMETEVLAACGDTVE